MKRILFATSEAVPFIKTGGLADVAGALPKCFDKRYAKNISQNQSKIDEWKTLLKAISLNKV